MAVYYTREREGVVKRLVGVDEASDRLDDLIEAVHDRGDEVVIQRGGETVAVVIPAERYAALERNRERMWELLEKAQGAGEQMTEQEVSQLVDSEIWEVRRAQGRYPFSVVRHDSV
ncbi:MAG: type II toxin-antitoxin system Phd/YefM family antitoxin [Dehalococcoidia bacterium]|nr:type II toxin-antitoxin system Phd/YefM family antitoxin [Dehalococcoidia bacterium]